MRLILTMITMLLLVSFGATAQPIAGHADFHLDGTRYEVSFTLTFSPDELSFGKTVGYDTIRLQGGDVLSEAGVPQLPVQILHIAMPEGMRVTGERIEDRQAVELPGEYMLLPARPPRPIGLGIPDGRKATPNPDVYDFNDPFPARTADFLYQADLAGQSIAVLRIHPLQYLPATGRLVLTESMRIVLDGVSGWVCGDHLPARASEHSRSVYERMVEGMVANPEDVRLAGASGMETALTGVDPGTYEYVIITYPGWVDDFQPLADWRTKKGSPTRIVTTDWIYYDGGYEGTFVEMVRAFVQDAHNTWGATYFLLGADTHIIPDHIRTITVPGYSTDDIPNDTYYADYDDDWICEVHVGRISARNTDHIATALSKIFTYEKDPPLSEYATMAALFGFDITVPGDHDGETCKEMIRSQHFPPYLTVNTEYDDEPGTHKTDVINYLNQGHHLVNHHDHCNSDVMGVGWISHSDLLVISDVNALTNGQRQSILFAVGCNPCDVPFYISIGEAMLHHPTGGAIAFMGNSRTGWGGPPEDPDWYSVRQDRFFYRNLFDDGFERLGENYSDLKNDEYSPDDPYNVHQYCFTQLHLLGDPELTIWTRDPEALTVQHEDSLTIGGYTTFPVEVSSGGNPLDGATVCLWKNGDIYEISQTVSGIATFGFVPSSEGTMYVTVCRQNYLSYEGETEVKEGVLTNIDRPERASARPALVTILPGSVNPGIEITYSIPTRAGLMRLDIYNCLGQRVRTLADGEALPGVHKISWDRRTANGLCVPSGAYFCKLSWNEQNCSRRFVLVE